jgi:hypothetical protein
MVFDKVVALDTAAGLGIEAGCDMVYGLGKLAVPDVGVVLGAGSCCIGRTGPSARPHFLETQSQNGWMLQAVLECFCQRHIALCTSVYP